MYQKYISLALTILISTDIDRNEDGIQNGQSERMYCFTEKEINSVIDVLDVNAFEIRGNDFSIRGVYPLTAMMNSVCCPNTQNCIG